MLYLGRTKKSLMQGNLGNIHPKGIRTFNPIDVSINTKNVNTTTTSMSTKNKRVILIFFCHWRRGDISYLSGG